MEIANLIVNVIGFVGLACYIWVLRGQISSQNKTIENLKLYVDIFQPEKLREFVKIREETFEDKKNKEIEKIKEEMKEKLDTGLDAMKIYIEEYEYLLPIVFGLSYYVAPELRKVIMKDAPKGLKKALIVNKINEFPYYGDVYANELRRAFLEKDRERERNH
jgi:hypothetical protein